jgi:hypothetical protein
MDPLGIVTNALQPVLLGVAFLLVGGWLVALGLAPSASRLSGRTARVDGGAADVCRVPAAGHPPRAALDQGHARVTYG